MRDETEDGPEPFEPGWRERLWAVGAALGRLLETRTAIFQEELAQKGDLLGKALLGFFVALLFGTIAGLLLTALLAALLARLFGSPVLGILVTLVLYLGVAAGAGAVAVKKLSRLRPFEFPATRSEIDRDLEAVRQAAGVGAREPRGEGPDTRDLPAGARGETTEEMEARLREGAG
jgi:uncharacterized membrane protein YqjE